MRKPNKRLKQIVASILAFSIIAALFVIPAITNAGLCDDLAGGSSFLDCNSSQTTFTNFQGGLEQPSAEGYAPELTQARTAREFILQVTNFILGFLGLAAVLAIIYGGVMYVGAGGEEERATKGKKSIMYSVMGLIVVMASWSIVNTVIQAPSGTDRGAGIAGNQGAGIDGSQTAIGERDFSVAARRIQNISREYISNYEKFLQNDELIQQYYNLDERPQVQDNNALLSFLNQKATLITQIENRAPALGILQEMARINRINLQQFTQMTRTAFEQESEFPDIAKAGLNILLPGLGTGVDAGMELKNRAEISTTGNNLNLEEANKVDFMIAVDKQLMELNEVIRPIANGKSLVKTFRTERTINMNEDLSAPNASGKQTTFSYILDKPTVNLPPEITDTKVGYLFQTAFDTIAQSADNPNNSTIRYSIQTLGELHDAVKGLLFIDAVINASKTRGNAPFTVTFDALLSQDPNGETIDSSRIHWDLDGDGTFEGEPAAVKNYTFYEPGTYRIRMAIDSIDPETILDGFSMMTIIVEPPESHINLSYRVGNKNHPIMKWKQTSIDGEQQRTLEIDRNAITVTLNEAQAGITFDASETRDKFFNKESIKRFTWDFGDNSTFTAGDNPSQDNVVTHQYAEAGSYQLTLEVEDEAGTVDRKIVTVIIKDTAARITATPGLKGEVGDKFTFDGGDSRSSIGQIARYIWSIQKEGSSSAAINNFANEDEITYTFDQPGKYRISLTVEDPSGDTDRNATDEITIEITSKPPVAQFLHTTPRLNQPNTIHFDGSKSFDPDGDGFEQLSRKGLSYKWTVNAESGSYSLLPPSQAGQFLTDNSRPIIKFNKKGNYTVGLQVKEKQIPNQPAQESEIFERTIQVDKVLAVDWQDNMRVTSQLKDGEGQIKFNAKAENAISYEIRYGDGEKDSGQVPSSGSINTTHSYTKAGEYEVDLLVFDEDNDETVISRKVFIGDGKSPIPVVRLGVNGLSFPEFTSPRRPLVVNRKDLINFDASESINLDGTGRRLDYKWDFNDGSTSTEKNTQRSYRELSPTKPGYYTVKLTVVDKDSFKAATTFAYILVKSEEPYFLGITAVPEQSELTTPVKMRVQASGVEDPDGEVVQYRWWYYDVRDPSNELGIQITTTPATTINLGTKGKEGDDVTYRFGLEVTDNENFKFETRDLQDQGAIPAITVTNGPNKPPVAEFTVDRTNILAGESVTFTSASTDPDGKIAQYIWDVEGDGFHNNRPTNQSTITHIYKKANKQGAKARLKVIDNNYAESSSTPVTIYIDSNSTPPSAAFKFEQLPKSQKIKFINNSTADEKSKMKLEKFIWDFDISSQYDSADSDGDGQKDNDIDSTQSEPTHEYKLPGIYRVKLIVEDTDGNTDEVINFVNVKSQTSASNTITDTDSESDPFGIKDPLAPKSSAPEPLEARMLTEPKPSPDNKIHLSGTSQEISFDFTTSKGNIVEAYLDKNIYFDTNGNGINDDDKDYRATQPGKFTTNFEKEWGRTRVRFTVEDASGKKDRVEKDVVFDSKSTSSDKKDSPFLGPENKISTNIFKSIANPNGLWLIVGTLFAIISLTFAKLRR